MTRSFRSFAKINLGLEVAGKLPGGYHALRTLFATLSLHDVVDIAPRRSGIALRCDHPGVPTDESNLAFRAAALMQQISGRKRGVEITLHKRIAIGGGLGGGSSNAATVLRALDLIWNLGLGPAGLIDAARSLGADVPYFLFGGPALGLGRGDEIQPLNLRLKEKVLLVQGSFGVSTAAVFKQYAAEVRRPHATSRIEDFLRSIEAASAGGRTRPLGFLRNELEPAAAEVSAPLAERARRLRRLGRSTGALHTAMSGSGSSFFLLFDDAAKEDAAVLALREQGVAFVRCSFLSASTYRSRFEITAAR